MLHLRLQHLIYMLASNPAFRLITWWTVPLGAMTVHPRPWSYCWYWAP